MLDKEAACGTVDDEIRHRRRRSESAMVDVPRKRNVRSL